ncbi:hypothetical protein BGZ67_004758 [Mortierella alpina]|nr:hypothetical protein BGZ67_004758 [Mortierella alpina]
MDRKETDDSEKYWRRSVSTSRASESRDQVEYSLSSEALSWNILARDAQAQHPLRIYFNGSSQATFSGGLQKIKTARVFEEDGTFHVKAKIPKHMVKEGFYSIIWCISPRHLGRLLLKELFFEVETSLNKYKLWTKLSEDRIASLDTSGMVRLRLQQKLHLRFDSPVLIRLFGKLHAPLVEHEALKGPEDHFSVHYVELELQGQDAPNDHGDVMVEAPGKKVQMLDVRTCQLPQSVTGYTPTAQIFAMDVSASGEYIAVLSATNSTIFIGIWDLEAALQSTSSSALHALASRSIISQPPVAMVTLPLQADDFDHIRLLRVALSSDGFKVAVYQQPNEDDMAPEQVVTTSFKFPFRLFQVKSSFIEAERIQEASRKETTAMIEELPVAKTMAHFVGYGKFLAKEAILGQDQAALQGGHDFFIACTESRINIYDASNHWNRLYGIAIGGLNSTTHRVRQLRTLFQSLEGSAFVWWEDKQNVSVWNLITGANLKYISVTNPNSRVQSEIEHLTVSKGGKLLVLGGSDWIKTYFMDSGIEICAQVIKDGRSILNLQFLDDDKSLLATMVKSTMEQSAVIMDALNLSLQQCTSRQFPTSSYSIQLVTRLSDRVTNGRDLEHVMMKANGNEVEMFTIPRPARTGSDGGSLVYCDELCSTKSALELDQHVYHIPGTMNSSYQLIIDFEEREYDNQHERLARTRLVHVDEHGSARQIMSIIPEPWNSLDVDEEDPHRYIQASFLPSSPQFIIVTSMGFHVWSLPGATAPDDRLSLNLAWVSPKSDNHSDINCYAEQLLEARVCIHGETVRPVWSGGKTESHRTTCVRIPKSNWLTSTDTLHCIHSLPLLIICYSDASSSCQDAIIRYITKHVNSDPPPGTTQHTVMSKIAWTARWRGCSDVLRGIFHSSDGKWIPRPNTPITGLSGMPQGSDFGGSGISGDASAVNPIVLLLKNAKKEPRNLPMAEQMIDYCIHEAKTQRDPAFLLIVLDCLPLLVIFHPEIAIDVMRRSAFIPVRDRAFVVNNSMIPHPPRFEFHKKRKGMASMSMVMLKRRRTPIYEAPNSVFQLKSQLPRIYASNFSKHIEVSVEQEVDPLNETFKRQVYVAPYALLWRAREPRAGQGMTPRTWRKRVDLSAETSYLSMAFGLVMDKLNPWSRQTIRTNFSELQYFDNPVVEALLEYKWNSFACIPWTVRFVSQLIYYAIVLTVTLLQVYPGHMPLTHLQGPFIAIIALGAMFLYLELQQFLADYWKYVRSPYNLVDLAVFSLPTIGSIQMLINMPKDENTTVIGNSRVLSFAIVIIYIHLLFEMRVVKSVCNIVTIILSIVGKIRVFFAIFAVSILAFSHSFLHLLKAQSHDCPWDGSSGPDTARGCDVRDTDFPNTFIGALSATYFFMAGRYDPIDKNLDSNDWPFHLMLAAYYFMTVILMLNVLIALMNVAFSAGDDMGPLVWLENRLRSVEGAENMSYCAPGLRQRFDWFPQYIYYTASPRQVQAFENKYPTLSTYDDEGYSNPSSRNPSHAATPTRQMDQESIIEQAQLLQAGRAKQDGSSVASLLSSHRLGEGANSRLERPSDIVEESASDELRGVSHSVTDSTVLGSPAFNTSPQAPHEPLVSPTSHRLGTGAERQYFADTPLRERRRYAPPARETTAQTLNLFRGKNDLDGNGIDDKFERDDVVYDDSGPRSVGGAGSSHDPDRRSVKSRTHQDDRERQIQTELRAVQDNTEELRENVRGLEGKIDRMAALIEQLLQQQQQ